MANNSWDLAKKLLSPRDRQALGGSPLSPSDQYKFDLLNQVGGDTSVGTYHHDEQGQPIPAKERAGFNPSNLKTPSPAAATNISAGPPIPPSSTLNAPRQPEVRPSFNSDPIDYSRDPNADTQMYDNRKQANDLFSRITATPIKDVPRGSGFSQDNKAKASTESKGVRTRSTFVSPDEWDYAQTNLRSLPEIENIRKNQAEMRDMVKLGLTHSKVMPDLGVLKDFAKNISGGRVTMDGYNAPKPTMDARDALALLSGNRKTEEDLLTRAADTISKQKSGTYLESVGNQQSLESRDAVDDSKRYQPKAAKGVNLDPEIERLGKSRLAAAPILEGVKTLDDLFKKSGWEGGIKGAKEELMRDKKLRHDVPGVGGLKSVFGSILPAALSNEGSPLYATLKDMALAKLQMRSGAQASEAEAKRYLSRFGLTVGAGDREVVNGVDALIKDMKSTLHADESRFNPAAVAEYRKRPGRIVSEDFDPFIGMAISPGKAEMKGKAGQIDAKILPPQAPSASDGANKSAVEDIDKQLAEIEAKLNKGKK